MEVPATNQQLLWIYSFWDSRVWVLTEAMRTRVITIFSIITLYNSKGQSSWRHDYKKFFSHLLQQIHSNICRVCTPHQPEILMVIDILDNNVMVMVMVNKSYFLLVFPFPRFRLILFWEVVCVMKANLSWTLSEYQIFFIKVRKTNLFIDFSSLTGKVCPAVATRVASFLLWWLSASAK